jgi:sensor histidine kinase YesM
MQVMDEPPPVRRSLLRWLGVALLVSAVLGALFTVPRGGSFVELVLTTAIGMMYSVAIGLPMTLVFRRIGPRLHRRSELMQWFAFVGVVVAVSAVGTFVAGFGLVGLGLTSLDELWETYLRGFEIAMIIAVPCTIGGATFAKLHARVARSEEAARMTEREAQRAFALATEARLASLESRVRPHFLFNALNSAIALIPEDPRRAEKLLERLAGLLRFSLDAAATVSLGEELRIVTDYLEIERVRFGDRLRYRVDVADELAAASLPAFAVQTLVENSVKYAVSARKAGATITVCARRAGDRLVLEIRDDGPGFTDRIWVPGHGLDGLRARLDALYGGDAKLVAPAESTSGAAVTLELPAPEVRMAVAR